MKKKLILVSWRWLSHGKRGGVIKRTLTAWSLCISIYGLVRNLKCTYCQKELIIRIYQLKHHLAVISKDVEALITVIRNVKKIMMGVVISCNKI